MCLGCQLQWSENISRSFDKLGILDHLVVTAGGGNVSSASFVEAETSIARSVLGDKFWVQYNTAKHGAKYINPIVLWTLDPQRPFASFSMFTGHPKP